MYQVINMRYVVTTYGCNKSKPKIKNTLDVDFQHHQDVRNQDELIGTLLEVTL